MSDKPEQNFYVSNSQLYGEYVEWYANIKQAEAEGLDPPQIPPFIVDAMMKISHKLSYAPNFINYSFKEEMISDALYDCVRFADRFKLKYISKKTGNEETGNAFSYITTICYNAFIRRIDKEKTQNYIKARIVAETADHEFFDNQSHEEDGQFVNQYIEFLRETGYTNDCVPMSVKRSRKNKAAAELQKGPLEDFDNE